MTADRIQARLLNAAFTGAAMPDAQSVLMPDGKNLVLFFLTLRSVCICLQDLPVGRMTADSMQAGLLKSALTGVAIPDAQQPGLHPHYTSMPPDLQPNAVTPPAATAHNTQQQQQ